MTITQLRAAVWQWLSDTLGGGVTVIYMDQTAPQPPKPYAAIRLLTVTKLGLQDELLQTISGGGMQTIKQQRTAAFMMQFFGAGSLQRAEDARASLQKPSVLEDLFYSKGLAVLNDPQVTNITALLETEFEDRAQLDVLFGYGSTDTDDVGLIETVELTNTETGDEFTVSLN